jgi:hypothetical protein
MLMRQISLKHGVTVSAANVSSEDEIQAALDELGIPHPRTTIVLVGGAGGIDPIHKFPIQKAVRIVAQLAEETGAVVVDGGTRAGIMVEMGEQRIKNGYTFPLIGVVFDALLMRREPSSILDPGHTHFIVIPGNAWGDESAWIAKIAAVAAGDRKSVTVLVNGGKVSRADVEYSLMANRPTAAIRGTGRLADEITLTDDNVFAIDVSREPDEILEVLKTKL